MPDVHVLYVYATCIMQSCIVYATCIMQSCMLQLSRLLSISPSHLSLSVCLHFPAYIIPALYCALWFLSSHFDTPSPSSLPLYLSFVYPYPTSLHPPLIPKPSLPSCPTSISPSFPTLPPTLSPKYRVQGATNSSVVYIYIYTHTQHVYVLFPVSLYI